MQRSVKSAIREDALFRRDAIDAEVRGEKDRRIRERFAGLSEFKSAGVILLYASFRSEVDTFGIIELCLSSGKGVALPKVDRTSNLLRLYKIKNIEELSHGYFGIQEPLVDEGRIMDIDDFDLIIVPGVAFDEMCNRMGYGKGFYDKLLGNLRRTGNHGEGRGVALAYEEQIVKAIPAKPYDIKMDKIITDERIIECHG
ncbi:MAG: 5-formyltetrahydrofolate cyclo-ligase [Nitrospirae bacterium]|nr:5-formyltetrahydrofolate cyclo-ligase [Nitrospirota bacterium]